jgi:uncharacterized protein YjlB
MEVNPMNAPKVKTFFFKDDGMMPNNPNLPVILYPGAIKDHPERTESMFNGHNWTNSWTNGVFDYHHYHSNTHEVLGVIKGSVVLQLGGDQGQKVELHIGDVVVLPAGTAHKRLSASSSFQVVGAYPNGMDYNMNTGKAGERAKAREAIPQVPIPETDPVYGKEGPLIKLWRKG